MNTESNEQSKSTSAVLAVSDPARSAHRTDSSSGEQGEGNKGGRPSKFSKKVISRLLASLRDGCTITQSCLAAGIGVTTFRRWKTEHPELEPKLTEAREQARQKALALIKSIAETASDWRGIAEWLRLSFQADYRRDGVTVNALSYAGQTVEVTDETRQRLIKLREAALALPNDEVVRQPRQVRLSAEEIELRREGSWEPRDDIRRGGQALPAPPPPAPAREQTPPGLTDLQRIQDYPSPAGRVEHRPEEIDAILGVS
jgi:hypothetical protein